jgi:NAD dependent epimerase/dehydratase family enzyme
MPSFLLRAFAGEVADDLLIGGQRVLPDKAIGSGFTFRHETLASALSALLGGADAGAQSRAFAKASEMLEAR